MTRYTVCPVVVACVCNIIGIPMLYWPIIVIDPYHNKDIPPNLDSGVYVCKIFFILPSCDEWKALVDRECRE